jgi:putative two-component system response regulator
MVTGGATAGQSMNPKKILIVDDDQVQVGTLMRLLNDVGYDILTAADGSEAVSVARRERPDLILLDILFPPDVGHGGGIPWDGYLIIDWLRRQEEAANIPVIMMTAADAGDHRNRAFAKGAVGFFSKPINAEELVSLVRKLLGDESHQTSLLVRLPGQGRT